MGLILPYGMDLRVELDNSCGSLSNRIFFVILYENANTNKPIIES